MRKYRASYSVYIRSTDPNEPKTHREAARFIGSVSANECKEYGTPFPTSLTAPESASERENLLLYEVGYGFLESAWGHGYATEAVRAFANAYVNACGAWSPPFERVRLLGVVESANAPSRRVLEKIGFGFSGVHRWEGQGVFIGGAVQPPEVCVYSFGPVVCS
jgi:RimJ/RimL family protein N-acetyltransferase